MQTWNLSETSTQTTRICFLGIIMLPVKRLGHFSLTSNQSIMHKYRNNVYQNKPLTFFNHSAKIIKQRKSLGTWQPERKHNLYFFPPIFREWNVAANDNKGTSFSSIICFQGTVTSEKKRTGTTLEVLIWQHAI